MTADEITKILKHKFKLKDWLPTDPEYLPVEPEQVREWLFKYRDPQKLYIPHVWACEEIADWFKISVRRDLARQPIVKRFNYALGEALGTKWNGVKMQHHANIFITPNREIWLCDAHSEQMWKADNDEIFFVEM